MIQIFSAHGRDGRTDQPKVVQENLADLKTKVTTVIKITQFPLFIWTWLPSFSSKYREDSDSYHRYNRVWISRCFCCQQELFSDFSKTNISKLRSNLSKSQTLVVVMLTQVTIWIPLKVTNCLNIAKTGDPELQRHFWFNSLCRLLTNPSKLIPTKGNISYCQRNLSTAYHQ